MDEYTQLLLKYVPRVVKTPEEYSKLFDSILELSIKDPLTKAESDMLELLDTIEHQYVCEVTSEKNLLKLESEME